MKQITKSLIAAAQMLEADIDKSRVLQPGSVSPNYRSSGTLQKWVNEKRSDLLNLCADPDTRNLLESWIESANDPNTIISDITKFIAISAIPNPPDFTPEQFPIYADPLRDITAILATCSDSWENARIEYENSSFEAEEDDVNNQNSFSQLVPITANECIDYPPVRYILDGIIEAETITLISGKEKIGKTYILMDLALHMAAKLPWLDFDTMGDEKGNVLWLDFDMNRITTMRRINQITNGIEESWNVRRPNLFNNFGMMDAQLFHDAGYKDNFQFFNESDAVQGLKEYMIANNVKVCFIDNLVQIEGKAEENSSNDIQLVFRRLKQLREETHAAFILVHHTTKDGYRGRGSSAIFGETDLNLQLEPCTNPDQLLLNTDGARNTAKSKIGMMKEFVPRLSYDGITPLTDDNGHIIYNFKLSRIDTDGLETVRESGSKVKTAKTAETLERNIGKIKDLFSENNNSALSQSEITKHLTGTNDSRKNAISEAFNRQILEKNTAGQYCLQRFTKFT